MKNKLLISIIVLIVFVALNYLRYIYAYFIGTDEWNNTDEIMRTLLVLLPKYILVAITAYLITKQHPIKVLGLEYGFYSGLFYGFLFTLPMFIGYAIYGTFNKDMTGWNVFNSMVSAGFGEEYFYRAFLFGILFFYCGWGFIPAALIASVFFGAGHLYQANELGSALGVFAFTAMASIGFALMYMTWQSLWLPVFLHGFMDLSWDMFSIETDVRGNTIANVFRFITIGLAVYFSIRKGKRERFSLRGRLWVNRESRLIEE